MRNRVADRRVQGLQRSEVLHNDRRCVIGHANSNNTFGGMLQRSLQNSSRKQVRCEHSTRVVVDNHICTLWLRLVIPADSYDLRSSLPTLAAAPTLELVVQEPRRPTSRGRPVLQSAQLSDQVRSKPAQRTLPVIDVAPVSSIPVAAASRELSPDLRSVITEAFRLPVSVASATSPSSDAARPSSSGFSDLPSSGGPVGWGQVQTRTRGARSKANQARMWLPAPGSCHVAEPSRSSAWDRRSLPAPKEVPGGRPACEVPHRRVR